MSELTSSVFAKQIADIVNKDPDIIQGLLDQLRLHESKKREEIMAKGASTKTCSIEPSDYEEKSTPAVYLTKGSWYLYDGSYELQFIEFNDDGHAKFLIDGVHPHTFLDNEFITRLKYSIKKRN